MQKCKIKNPLPNSQLMINFPQEEQLGRNKIPTGGLVDLIADEAVDLIHLEDKLYSVAGAVYNFAHFTNEDISRKSETFLLTTFWLKLVDLAREVNLISNSLTEYLEEPANSDNIVKSYEYKLKELEAVI